jgi:hypothetical protein
MSAYVRTDAVIGPSNRKGGGLSGGWGLLLFTCWSPAFDQPLKQVFFRSLTMTDNVELRLRFTHILDEIAALFGPLIDAPDPGPIRRFIGKRFSPGGPPPVPWRQRMLLGRSVGEALIGAAQLKVAAQMAGNEELAVAVDRRIARMLDEDLCPLYGKVIKLPPVPFPPEPGPRPDELTVTWTDFELLVSTLVDYHAGLPDGGLKDEIGGQIKQVAGPG